MASNKADTDFEPDLRTSKEASKGVISTGPMVLLLLPPLPLLEKHILVSGI